MSESQDIVSQINAINAAIEHLLMADELDAEQLNAKVVERDKLVQTLVTQLDNPDYQSFAREQLTYNQSLQEKVVRLFEQTESQLSGLMKSRKAIKKYKKS